MSSNLDYLIVLLPKVGREQMALEFTLHGAPASQMVVLHNRSAALLANGEFMFFREAFCHSIPISLLVSPLLPHYLLTVNITSATSPDVVKFPSPDLVLGTGHLSSQLLLFTLHHGVVSLSQTTVVGSTTPSVSETTRTAATSLRYL